LEILVIVLENEFLGMGDEIMQVEIIMDGILLVLEIDEILVQNGDKQET